MAHEIAKLMLEHAHTFLDRQEAIKTAVSLGMPLHEIEEYLDWVELVHAQSSQPGGTIEDKAIASESRRAAAESGLTRIVQARKAPASGASCRRPHQGFAAPFSAGVSRGDTSMALSLPETLEARMASASSRWRFGLIG